MTSIKFISNTKEKVRDNINEIFGWAEEIDIAVAYLKNSGYGLVKNLLDGKRIRILLGIDFWLTDVELLRDILNKGYPCKIYRTPMSDVEKSYHPKIYIAKRKNDVRVIVGSSNLTNGGFYSNVEGNILLSGDKTTPGIKEILDFFEEKWKSSLAEDINDNLINEYADLKREYEKHTKQIHLKPSFISKTDKISSKGNSIIICMTKEHDRNDIYNRLVGVPDNPNTNIIAFERQYIKKGTRLFIYYIGHGISKVVEALDKPYRDGSIIPEWQDGLPERYPVRVRTRLLRHSTSSIKLNRLQDLGISRVDTGRKISFRHLQMSLTPISDNDGDTIEHELR